MSVSAQITNYQCPSCTGPLHYDGTIGKLRCDYCGSTFTVQEIEALYADKVEQAQQAAAQAAQSAEAETAWDYDAAGSEWGSESSGMKAYNCPSCGAELICDATTAATSCPYCGNPTVVPAQFHGMLKPDYILPFKLDKEAAKKALRAFYKGKRLLPRAFTTDNHIEEIKGVYVPFWLFDGQGDADLNFTATRVSTHRSGDYQVTVTDHYAVRRAGTVDFHRIPTDSSSKMPDAHMDAIEPFDFSELKPFSTAYMPGFLAERYDVDVAECEKRARRRAGNTTEQVIANTVREKRVYAPQRGELCDAAGVDALHPLERQELPLCHERPDGQAHRRSAGVHGPLLGLVRRHRGAPGGDPDGIAVPDVGGAG